MKVQLEQGGGAVQVTAVDKQTGRDLPWLNWLRFIAAFEVVLFHIRPFVFAPYAEIPANQHKTFIIIAGISNFGGDAVLIFFVLSGYLVGGNLIDRIASRSFDVRSYAINRSVRLMLPMVPAILYAVIIGWVSRNPVPATVVLGNLFFLQGVSVPVISAPYWSLSYEAWFYIIGGALAFLLTSRRYNNTSLAIISLGFMIFVFLDPILLLCWVIGAFAAIRKSLQFSPWLLGAGVLACVAGLLVFSGRLDGPETAVLGVSLRNTHFSMITTATGIAFVLQQIVLLAPRGGMLDAVERMGGPLAAFSYSLYLTHRPTLDLLAYLGMPTGQHVTLAAIAQIGFDLVACLAVGGVFYWLFERHTDAVRRMIRLRRTTTASAG